MTFVPQKAIKGQTLVDFLAAHPILETSKLHEDILDEVTKANITSSDDVWQMFFDSALKTRPKGKIVTGVGVVFISPENHVLPRVFSLMEPYSNNTMLCSLASGSLNRCGYNTLKLMAIPS